MKNNELNTKTQIVGVPAGSLSIPLRSTSFPKVHFFYRNAPLFRTQRTRACRWCVGTDYLLLFVTQMQDAYSPQQLAFNIDCMISMREFPDKYFDLAIVDPPYFSGPEKREFYGSKVSSIGVNRLYKKSAAWNVPGPEYFNELLRISKKYIVWGCNYYDFQFHTGRIVWDKVNDSSDYSDCELAATNLFDHVRIFRFMWNGMLQGSLADGKLMEGNKSKNEKRIHPTQKPVQLYRWQLKRFASEGWKILDTHLGSGSSRIAAYELGFDFTGYEIDPDYFAAQEQRFKQHTSQTRLFHQKVA